MRGPLDDLSNGRVPGFTAAGPDGDGEAIEASGEGAGIGRDADMKWNTMQHNTTKPHREDRPQRGIAGLCYTAPVFIW